MVLARVRRRRLVHDAPSEGTLRRRAQKMRVCLAALSEQVAEVLAYGAEAEWVFGRLYLLGLLSDAQYDAAVMVDRTTRRYRTMLAPHAVIKGWKPEALKQACPEDLSPAAQKRMLAAQQAYEQMYGILGKCGGGVLNTIFTMLETDALGDLARVHKGLNALLVGN